MFTSLITVQVTSGGCESRSAVCCRDCVMPGSMAKGVVLQKVRGCESLNSHTHEPTEAPTEA